MKLKIRASIKDGKTIHYDQDKMTEFIEKNQAKITVSTSILLVLMSSIRSPRLRHNRKCTQPK